MGLTADDLASFVPLPSDDEEVTRASIGNCDFNRAVTVGNPARAASAETTRPTVPLPLDGKSLDYSAFTAALTKLISTHLGLRGFTLTLAVDKASTIEELRDVAQRVLEQVRERKGEAAASEARKTLYGG